MSSENKALFVRRFIVCCGDLDFDEKTGQKEVSRPSICGVGGSY